ncbi:hypothetical protein L3Y34_010987 [Caenorhabditis briggsae]|uniref:Uncharacterized protein n=1 Tax=Caenorhabditis briggsae TaxID=6238 RepID=A0AAE9CTV8_CAEBR|nr:hypothetical protein L3Y34_010987 [Caenorhabditis briggsae]
MASKRWADLQNLKGRGVSQGLDRDHPTLQDPKRPDYHSKPFGYPLGLNDNFGRGENAKIETPIPEKRKKNDGGYHLPGVKLRPFLFAR